MTTTTAPAVTPLQNLYTGANPASVHADLLDVVEAAMLHQPRTLQTRIGPSEIGMDCVRCLAHKLAGTPERPEAAWLPYLGTAVHEELSTVFIRHEHTRQDLGLPPRFLSEHRVTVGTIGGQEITGSTDLFDIHTGTVIDFKVVGTATMRKAKAIGASDQYRIQANLYALGWEAAGYTVRSTLIWFMPRNAISLRDGYAWQAPVDSRIAHEALTRADTIAVAIAQLGAAAVIDAQPEHTGDAFTCRRYSDFHPLPAGGKSTDPFG